jgi:hypothetical protein
MALPHSRPYLADMRMIPAILLVAMVASPALAQSIGEPLPGRGQPRAEKLRPAQTERAARPCPEYGPGFVRVEGSSLCVRAGGSVQVEFGKSSSRSGYGSGAGGRLYLESRGETGLGSVRTVISTQGRIERNLESGNWPYR